MVVFTAIGVGILASGFLGTTLTLALASSAFLLGLATTVVLGAAMRALMPKFSSGANRGYQTTAIGTALDHQVIYGKMRVAGARIYDEATGTNNKYLHRIVAIAGHEIESFDKIYINDSYVNFSDIDADGNISSVTDADGTTSDRYDDYVRIKFHYGSPTQVADADLVSESAHWTSAHKLSGIAYMYIRLKFNASVFPNGIPEFTAEVKGKKVSDPRNSTVAWSDNPALCLRDYLTSPYGISEDEDNIDDTLVIAAANVSDQLVGSPVFKMFVGGEYKIKTVGNTDFTLYGAPNNNVGTVFIATGFPTDQDESGVVETARYTCNGAFTTAATPYDMINALLTSMDGSLWYAQGKWRMKPAYWTAPVLDLNEDDLRSSISVSTRHSRRDNFNTVKGTFRGLESNWQTTDYPQVSNADFVTADNDQESVADVDLPFTNNSVEARRIALISLERNRQQLTVNASFGLKTLQVQVGDNIRLTNSRFGWDNKEFEVVSWNFGLTDGLDLQTQMTLRETAESVYDEVSDGVVYERDNTTLPSPFETAVPLNLLANSTSSVNDDGTTISQIAFSWSVANVNLVDHYEFEWKLSTDTNYNSFNMLESRFVLSPVGSNRVYNYRARSVNPLGVPSIWVYGSTTVETVDDQTVPNAPFGLSVSGGYGAAKVSWFAPTTNTDASTIKDLFQYEVYRGTSANPTTLIGIVSGTTFSDEGLLDSTTYHYRVKALDFTGNKSAYSSNGSGTTNPALVDGIDGLNNATVFLYNKSSSATPPALFSGTFTYTFSTGVLSGGTLNGWSQEPPSLSKGDNLWVSLATASSRTATDNSIPTAEFSTPEITSIAGIDGSTTARVSLFRKTSTNSAPADPSGTFTYTFATGVLSGGTLNGWSQSAPSLGNGEYLWVIQASAFSSNATDTIAASEFNAASITGIGGTDGPTGPSGDIYKTIYLYDAKVTQPASIAITDGFNASTGNASSTGTWTTTVPSVNSGQVLWLASLTLRQVEAEGDFSGQGLGWVITQAQGYKGDEGSDAPRFASRTLYTNPAVVTPTNTTPTATITWSTGALSSISSGWSETPPTQIANASEKVWSSNLLFADVSPPFSTTGATGSTPIEGTSFSGLVSFVDGDFALDGSTITNIDGGNITTGSIVADKITVDGTLTLAGPTSGFIGGRTTTADFGTDGFYVGRTSTNGTSADGFQLSHTSVTNSSHPQLASGVVQAIIHDDANGLRAYEPVFYQKGTGVGTNIVRHEGDTSNITLTKGEIHTVFLIGGGGGGGGTSLSQQNPNNSNFPLYPPVAGSDGNSTSVSLAGATGYTGTRSFSSAGGLGAPTTLRTKSSWTNGLIGDSSPFGTGGAGGVPVTNSAGFSAGAGQDAPTAHYGAAGGGASGTLFNDSGTSDDLARVGAWGGRVSLGTTINIDLTDATTDGILSVSIGAGGTGGNGYSVGDGGDGAGGAVSVSGIIDGYIPNTLEEIVNGTGSSDRTLKNNIRLLTGAEMRVAEAISFLQFELNSDPDHKRFGVIAQEVIEAFTAEGLNYNDYFVVVGQEGGYQVAYRQVLSLVAAATRQRLSSHTTSIANFEARISALEST